MKSKLLITLAALIVLSGCSSKISLVKRKYNKGYHFAVNHGKKAETPSKMPARTAAVNEQAEHVAIIKQVVPAASQEVQENKPFTAASPNNSLKVSKPAKPALLASASSNPAQEQSASTVKQLDLSKKKMAAQKAKASDSDLIIQIILALFPILCLIAIYLHDGKSITLNFWIDLILHITVIGEIIFALLVVLDIVDLG